MRVERGATPDGRLLLYFTFTPAQSEADAGIAGPPAAKRPPVVGR